jgi:hypothetical protein
VTTTVACDPYTDVFGQPQTSTPVDVFVLQVVRQGRVVQATGSGTVACDSTVHSLTITVLSSTDAFVRGPAIVEITPTLNSATTPPAPSKNVRVR